jgi:hypothetical protein
MMANKLARLVPVWSPAKQPALFDALAFGSREVWWEADDLTGYRLPGPMTEAASSSTLGPDHPEEEAHVWRLFVWDSTAPVSPSLTEGAIQLARSFRLTV